MQRWLVSDFAINCFRNCQESEQIETKGIISVQHFSFLIFSNLWKYRNRARYEVNLFVSNAPFV